MARNHSLLAFFAFSLLITVPVFVHADTGTALTSTQITCIGTAVHGREASMNTALSAYFDSLKTAYTSRATALDAAYGKTTLDELKNAESLARLSFSSSVLDAFAAMKRVQLSAETTYANAHQTCITGETNTNTGGNNENNSGNNNGNTNNNSGNTGNTNNGSGNTNGGGTATTTEPVASSTPTSTILFSDDFHRADGDVGNGWNMRSEGRGTSQGISSNRYVSNGMWDGASYVDRSISVGTSSFSIYTEFSSPVLISGRSGWEFEVGQLGTTGHSVNSYGYGVHLFPGISPTVRIRDNGVDRVSTNYTFNNTDVWAIEADYSGAPNNWISVYIWDTSIGESKPETPVLTWNNGGEPYIPLASGQMFYVNPSSDGLQSVSQFFIHAYSVTMNSL